MRKKEMKYTEGRNYNICRLTPHRQILNNFPCFPLLKYRSKTKFPSDR
ncbi:MAG: hypothetical protein FMNOHCHN_02676 [Ignavibacteriaceae bacterium]|nr:hypothetical protein [Ignavibacteriaceae bacterium]